MERSLPRVRIQPSPAPSPEKSKRSGLASLSMKSLVLKATVDSLLADLLSPRDSDDKTSNTSPGRNVDSLRDDVLSESDEKTRVCLPTLSVTDYDLPISSMDVTAAHHTVSLKFDETDS